jgi:threonylcarbamoyladenosine tRNA methylthiotransferase MtaB
MLNESCPVPSGSSFFLQAMPRVALHTLGCKLNYAETSAIGKQFLDRGYAIVDLGEPADVCVINTCSVTARANRECRQIIRRALRTAENPVVVVTGCYAQLEPEEVASIDGVDFVLGSREKNRIFHHLTSFEKVTSPRVFVSDISGADDFGPAWTTEAGSRTRAYLKVQDGCDYTCSFCTIPLARGGSRSLPMETVVTEAEDLVRQGFREIILTGVNVGDYGRKAGARLLDLLHALSEIADLARLRISSIEPNLLTDEIIGFVADHRVMCKHFHIPLQSGSDGVLHAMRRRYTNGQYAALVRKIRERIPDCGIGADVIVGFPGETDAQFEETYRFLNELPVSYLHVFTYSERPNTPAATYANPVPPAQRSQRSEMLRNLSVKKREAFYRSMIGRTVTVLTETEVEGDRRFGFTDNYVRVAVPSDGVEDNVLMEAVVEDVEYGCCVGTPVDEGGAA